MPLFPWKKISWKLMFGMALILIVGLILVIALYRKRLLKLLIRMTCGIEARPIPTAVEDGITAFDFN